MKERREVTTQDLIDQLHAQHDAEMHTIFMKWLALPVEGPPDDGQEATDGA